MSPLTETLPGWPSYFCQFGRPSEAQILAQILEKQDVFLQKCVSEDGRWVPLHGAHLISDFRPLLFLSTQVTEWMSKEGDQHLGQMKEEKAESLGSLNAIQKDFEKFYFTAMVSQGTSPSSNLPEIGCFWGSFHFEKLSI